MDEEQLQILWKSHAKNGGFKSFDEFKQLMSNSAARRAYFDSSNTELGYRDYDEFEGLLGVKKKGATVSADGGEIGGAVGTRSRSKAQSQSQNGSPFSAIAEVKKDRDNQLKTLTRQFEAAVTNGEPIDEKTAQTVRQYDPETYKRIAKAVLPVKTDRYIESDAAFNNLVGTLNDYAGAKNFLQSFKDKTGQEYEPGKLEAMTPEQRIGFGFEMPGDQIAVARKLAIDDDEKNNPVTEPSIFEEGFRPSVEEQKKRKEELKRNPEMQTDYLYQRQKNLSEKIAELSPYADRYSSESMNLEGGNADVLKVRKEKITEMNKLAAEKAKLNKAAGIIINPLLVENYLRSKGVTDINSHQAKQLLTTKDAREKLGMELALKTNPELVANLDDIESSLNKGNPWRGRGAMFGTAQVQTDMDSKFKMLSKSGDEKIQAQLRLQGYGSMIDYARATGNDGLLNSLLADKNNVAIENGAAYADELLARLGVARFKDNNEEVSYGIGDITADNLRKWGVQSGFTPVEMAILEKTIIPDETARTFTTNLPTSGFFRKGVEALGGSAVSIANLFRTDAARVRENLNESAGKNAEVGKYTPFIEELKALEEQQKAGELNADGVERLEMLRNNTNVLNMWQLTKSGLGNVTGQVAGMALSAKGIDKVFKALGAAKAVANTSNVAYGQFGKASAGIADDIFANKGIVGKGADYINETKSLFLSSYGAAYDLNKKDALRLMPGSENESNRLAYAHTMSLMEGLSEQIFDDRKILNAFGKTIRPAVKDIVEAMGKGTLTSAAAMGKLKSTLLGTDLKKFLLRFAANDEQEAREEWVVDVVGDIAKSALLGQDYDFNESMGSAFKTYTTMLVDGALVAGMGARSDVRNTTLNKTSLYHVARSPVDYRQEVNRLFLNGSITQKQADEKMQIINTANAAYTAMVRDGVVYKNGKNDVKNATYLLHTVNSATNKQRAEQTTDEIVKKHYTNEAKRSDEIREGIYNGTVHVDEFMNPFTTDEKLAQELDISSPLNNELTPVPAVTITADNLDDIDKINMSEFAPQQKKVMSDVKSVLQSISKLVSGDVGKKVSVTTHTDREGFENKIVESVVNSGGTQQEVEAAKKEAKDAKGFWMGSNGEVHLNMNEVTAETMLHEGFHPILNFMEKHSPGTIDKLHGQLAGIEGAHPFVNEAKRDYAGTVTQKKEAITDFIANVANGNIKIQETNFEKIKAFINQVLETVGLKDYAISKSLNLDNAKDLKQLAKVITGKFKAGEEIKAGDLGVKEKAGAKAQETGTELSKKESAPAAKEKQETKKADNESKDAKSKKPAEPVQRTQTTTGQASQQRTSEKPARSNTKREEVRTSLVKLRDEGLLRTADKSLIARAKRALGIGTPKVKMTDKEIDAQMQLMDAMAGVWKRVTGKDNFYDTFIDKVQKGDLAALQNMGGALFQDASTPKRPVARVTLAVFDIPQFEKMKGQMVAPQAISDLMKGKGKQIEKELISTVLGFEKYKGQKRIPFDEFRADVDMQVMKLERIITHSYASYGDDNMGDNEDYGVARTIILNAPIEHGQKGHFSNDFVSGNDGNITEWELREIPGTNTWAAVDKAMPAGVTADNLPNYVGTAGKRSDVEMWIAQRENNIDSQRVNVGLFGHIRAWFVRDSRVMYIPEMQSDYFQKNDAKELLKQKIPQHEIDAYMNKEVWLPFDSAQVQIMMKDWDITVEPMVSEPGYKAMRNGEELARVNVLSSDMPGLKPGSRAYVQSVVSGFQEMKNNKVTVIYDADTKKWKASQNKFGDKEFANVDDATKFAQENDGELNGAKKYYDDFKANYDKERKLLEVKEQEYVNKRIAEMDGEGENDIMLKQFVASAKVHELRLLREAIAYAASEGAETARFPMPYTLAVIEGYVNKEGDNEAPYEIVDGDSERLSPGDIISYGGERMIVVDAGSDYIKVAPRDEVNTFNYYDWLNEEVNYRFSELEYEVDKEFVDKHAITKEEIEKYNDSGSSSGEGYYLIKRAYKYLENNPDEEVVDWDEIKDKVQEDIESSTSDMGVEDMGGYDATYWDGDTVYGVTSRSSVEEFKQPDDYDSSTTETDFEEELTDGQQTVVNKYKELGRTLEKMRPDIESVYDDNGMEWLETKITEADRNNPIVAFQQEGADVKGAVDFMNNNKAAVHIFDGADVSTLVHEMSGHIGRKFLEAVAQQDESFAKDYETVKKWAKVKDNQWSRFSEEKFARGFERYLRNGKAPTEALKSVFEKMKDWLTEIYKMITGSSIDVKLTPEVTKVFDRMLGAESAPEFSKKKDAVTIGITPFAGTRIPKYQELNRLYDQAIQNGNTANASKIRNKIAKDLETRLRRIIPDADFKIMPSTGVWKGDTEPTFYVTFKEANDDVLAALAKVADEFDQDEVHIRDNKNVDKNIPGLEIQPDGSYNTIAALIKFNDGNYDFPSIASKHGFAGATVIGKNTLLLYNTDLPSDTITAKQITDDFIDKVNNLTNDNAGNVRTSKTEVTKLIRYSRDGRERGTTSYGDAIGNLHPQEATRKRLAGETEKTKLGAWASAVLSGAQQFMVDIIKPLSVKLKNPATIAKLTKVGKQFDDMPLINKAPIIYDAYRSLVHAIESQYKKLPIKVKPNSVPLKLKDGSIVWQEEYAEPYKNSTEVSKDIENNNQMVFYATNPGTFGSVGVDYTGHPMLEKSPFKSAAVQVYEAGEQDADGRYEIGELVAGETAQYDLLQNDLLRVVHDFYAHATTGAEFGARGEEKAWATHVATILKEPGLSSKDKLLAIWALTSETRGQNTWVNFINEHNKVVNAELDKARALERDGKVQEAEEIRSKYKYPNGIQFSDQKVGLLPTDALMGEHEETKQNDAAVQKLISDNPSTVSSVLEAQKNPVLELSKTERSKQRNIDKYEVKDGRLVLKQRENTDAKPAGKTVEVYRSTKYSPLLSNSINYFTPNIRYSKVFGSTTRKYIISLDNMLDLEKYNNILRDLGLEDFGGQGTFTIGDIFMDDNYAVQRDLLWNYSEEAGRQFDEELKNADVIKGEDAGMPGVIAYAVRNRDAVLSVEDGMEFSKKKDAAKKEVEVKNEIIKIISERKRGNAENPVLRLLKPGEELLQKATEEQSYFGRNIAHAAKRYIFVPVSESKAWDTSHTIDFEYYPKPNENTQVVRVYDTPYEGAPKEYAAELKQYPKIKMYDDTLVGEDGKIIDDRYQNVRDWSLPINNSEVDKAHLFRGLSKAELIAAIKNGYIKSDARLNIGDKQANTTSFAQNPSQATHYAFGFTAWYDDLTFQEPRYVIKIKRENVEYKPTMEKEIYGEVDVFGKVPIENIVEVHEVKLSSSIKGFLAIREERGKISEGSRSGMQQQAVTRQVSLDEVVNPVSPAEFSRKKNKIVKFTKFDGTTIDVNLDEVTVKQVNAVSVSQLHEKNSSSFGIFSGNNQLGFINLEKKGEDIHIGLSSLFHPSSVNNNASFAEVVLVAIKKLLKKIGFKKDFILTKEKNQGLGIGTMAYEKLGNMLYVDYGKIMRSDVTRSDAAENLWASFERKGMARAVGDKTGKRYDYHYEFIPLANRGEKSDSSTGMDFSRKKKPRSATNPMTTGEVDTMKASLQEKAAEYNAAGKSLVDFMEYVQALIIDLVDQKKLTPSQARDVLKNARYDSNAEYGKNPATPLVQTQEQKDLNYQIKTLARAAKTVEGVRKEFAAQINAFLDDAVRRGRMSVKQATVLAKRAADVGINPVKLDKFVDYASKVIADAEYAQKVADAKALRGKIKRAINGKAWQRAANNIASVKAFLRINPSDVAAIDNYIRIADAILSNSKGVTARVINEEEVQTQNEFYRVSNERIDKYVADHEAYAEQRAKEKLAATYSELIETGVIDPASMTLEEMNEIIEALSDTDADKADEYLAAQERKEMKLAALKKLLNYQKEQLRYWHESDSITTTPETLEVINDLLAIDVDKLNVKQLIKLNDVINNIITNDSFVDAGNIAALAKVQRDNKEMLRQERRSGITLGSIKSAVLNGLASVNLLVEFIAKSTKLAAEIQRLSGISGIFNGHAQAKALQEKTLQEYMKLRKGFGLDIDSAENRYRRGIYAAVIQHFGGDTAAQQAEFVRVKGLIKQTADRLQISEIKREQEEGRIVQAVYDELLENSNSADDVLSKMSIGNLAIVSFWMNKFAQNSERTAENAELYDNKIFEDVVNYTSTKYKSFNAQVGVSEKSERDIFEQIYFNKKVDNKMAGTKQARIRTPLLPQNSVLDLDFDAVQGQRFYETNYDVYTKKAIAQARLFFESAESSDILGGVVNRKILMDAVRKTVVMQSNKTPPVEAWEKAATSVLNSLQAKGVRIALGGVSQTIKQYPSVALNTLFNLGADMGLYVRALFVSNKIPLFDKYNIGLRGGTQAGFNREVDYGSIDRSTLGNSVQETARQIGSTSKKLMDFAMAALTVSDVSVARTSWLAYYMQSLKQQDIDISEIDWKTEHENPNEKAAAYAEQMVSRSQNPNDVSAMAAFYKDSVGSKGILKNMLMPFSSFALNQRMRMTNDMQKLLYGGQKVEALKSLAGTVTEIALFNAVKVYIIGQLTTAGAQGIAAMFGMWDDDDDEKQKEKEEDIEIIIGGKTVKVSPKFRKTAANTISDFFFSGMGTAPQTWANKAMNAAYRLAATEKYANGYTNYAPSLFYIYDPAKYGEEDYSAWGMYGIPLQRLQATWNLGEVAITGKTDNVVKGGKESDMELEKKKVTDKERAVHSLMFAVEALGLAGASDADLLMINKKLQNIVGKRMDERYGYTFLLPIGKKGEGEVTPEVLDFVKRISEGEDLSTEANQEFYKKNKAAIESAMKPKKEKEAPTNAIVTDDVKDFVKRISEGEDLSTEANQKFYNENKAAIKKYMSNREQE